MRLFLAALLAVAIVCCAAWAAAVALRLPEDLREWRRDQPGARFAIAVNWGLALVAAAVSIGLALPFVLQLVAIVRRLSAS